MDTFGFSLGGMSRHFIDRHFLEADGLVFTENWRRILTGSQIPDTKKENIKNCCVDVEKLYSKKRGFDLREGKQKKIEQLHLKYLDLGQRVEHEYGNTNWNDVEEVLERISDQMKEIKRKAIQQNSAPQRVTRASQHQKQVIGKSKISRKRKYNQDFKQSDEELDNDPLERVEHIPVSKHYKESPGSSQQLIEEDNAASKWENVRTVEDAKSLIEEGTLPDKHTLCSLVKRYGRRHAVVSLVCESICKRIQETTPDVTRVFAAYTMENKDKVHFIASLDDISCMPYSMLDYDIVCRNNKSNESESEQIQEEMSLSPKESLALRKTINAEGKQYMGKHEYLSAITARKIKFEEGENVCIIMYVHPCTDRYSSIPINEEQLPNEINGFKVVVRNGVFKTATNTLTAVDYHKNLRMGCQITSKSSKCGTLGGFIDHPEYGLCGFTCAHVVLDDQQLQDLHKATHCTYSVSTDPCQVHQPSRDSDPIGRVVEAVFTEGDHNFSAVDLALVQIEDRYPCSGTFPYSCSGTFPDSSSDKKLKYVTGETWGRTRLTCQPIEVKKFGVMTGFTTGKVMFDGMSVKTTTEKDGVNSTLCNLCEISNACEKGDSGGLVFMEDYNEELVCIGMTIGMYNWGNTLHSVFTPITDILRQLNVQKLKTFREELTVTLLDSRLADVVTKTQLTKELSDMKNEIIQSIKKNSQNLKA